MRCAAPKDVLDALLAFLDPSSLTACRFALSARQRSAQVIEMPVLAMCRSSGRELARFHRFIRPGYWDAFPEDMHRQSAGRASASHGSSKISQ